MKPEAAEIERLKREIVKLKAERDILKKPRPPSRRIDLRFAFIAKHRGSWPMRWICERSMSRAAGCMNGSSEHRARGRAGAPRSSAER
jgi:hypothetical protein